MTRNRTIPVLAALTAVALFAAIAAACGATDESSAGRDTLPEIDLIDLEAPDRSIDLAEPARAPRVINLWASWCAPCRAELPAFDEVAARAGDSIAMLGINVGEDVDAASGLVDDLGVSFPQSVDPTAVVTAELGVAGLPATLFATADGEILDIHSGPLDADELTHRLEELFDVKIEVGV